MERKEAAGCTTLLVCPTTPSKGVTCECSINATSGIIQVADDAHALFTVGETVCCGHHESRLPCILRRRVNTYMTYYGVTDQPGV